MNNPVTDQLLSAIKSSIKPAPSDSQLAFLDDYYHRLSTQDFSQDRVESLYDAAQIHYKLARKRRRGEVLIQADNQTLADGSRRTLISIVTDDNPFLISSLTVNITRLQYRLERTIHPIFKVERGPRGTMSAIHRYRSGDLRGMHEPDLLLESFIQFELDVLPESDHEAVCDELHRVIANIAVVTGDWSRMRDAALSIADQVEQSQEGPAFAEYGALLSWMADDHFAFLGYCEVTVPGKSGSKKSKKPAVPVVNEDSLCGILRAAHERGDNVLDILPPIIRSKTSPVVFTQCSNRVYIHRSNHPDCILIEHTEPGKGGKRSASGPRKVSCFVGFLGGSTATMAINSIPHLRSKAAFILAESSLRKGSYAYKELRTILETLPREMIFQLDSRALYGLCMTLLNQQERRRTRLHLNRNICGHFFSCLVYVSRDLFNSRLRQRIADYLRETLNGDEVTFDVYFSESILTRIQYTIFCDADGAPKIDAAALEKHVQGMARDFYENLLIAARETASLDEANTLARTWQDSFSAGYLDHFEPADALEDIAQFSTLGEGEIAPRLVIESEAENSSAHFRLYSDGGSVPLSDVLPVLDHMGIRVLSEHPYPVKRLDGKTYYINDFEVVRLNDEAFDAELAERFEQAFSRIWLGDAENDSFNQLILLAGFDWRQVSMIRGYVRYLKQVRLRYSEAYVIETLLKNPELSSAIGELFDGRFNPGHNTGKSTSKGNKEADQLEKKIQQMLQKVQTLDEERIIRALLDVLNATLRTNYYQQIGTDKDSKEHKSYISFKLDSRSIPRIPEPAPKYEIFVYSPRVEGVHLRGGDVARGGLRWSERPEDFRTEVLGLVKAQRVKNAVIVPVGSKGGFVAKKLPTGPREAIQEEVIACYRLFISALLDVTDNLVDGKIVPPKNVVRRDGDDPYLVVAADKGTATFSDIANALSEDYGFWLGDAFASGGSAGYDHKKMGITARGAWESVKRHFRELGRDIQTEPFTVAGIGDMGGDVFGNGMLLSTQTRLVAAFNHLHIFIDPDPDPKTSYKERKRLFDLPRSSWADYSTKLLSKGGAIYERSAKSIKLSKEAKRALGAAKDTYTPTDLINVILKARLDLLWNGGIGTYVKASGESHQDAQDRNNDSLRVDASELRIKVIGEGGNLGMTQLARIEFNQRGGLCYTDAIDNSAGVDTSDHEVNIKILLNAAMQSGKLSFAARNKQLAKMEKEVGELVLHNNYIQTQVVSYEANFSHALMTQQINSIDALEKSGLLNREIEFLPDNRTLQDRQKAEQWLTRAELAVLLSYSKMDLYQKMLDSSVPDDPYLKPEIERYFPDELVKKYGKDMQQHRLRREIVSTFLTNDMVGKLGPNFHLRIGNLTSSNAEAVVSAFVIARHLLELEAVHEIVRQLDNKASTEEQQSILRRSSLSAESVIVWLLRNVPVPLDISAAVKRFDKSISQFNTAIAKMEPAPSTVGAVSAKPSDNSSLDKKQAARLTLIDRQAWACDIIQISELTKQPLPLTTEVYFQTTDKLGLDWIATSIAALASSNDWNQRARFSLGETLRTVLSRLVSEVLLGSKSREANVRLAEWMDQHQLRLSALNTMMAKLRREKSLDFAMLSVFISELNLIGEEQKAT